jgi:hypothetical protein
LGMWRILRCLCSTCAVRVGNVVHIAVPVQYLCCTCWECGAYCGACAVPVLDMLGMWHILQCLCSTCAGHVGNVAHIAVPVQYLCYTCAGYGVIMLKICGGMFCLQAG